MRRILALTAVGVFIIGAAYAAYSVTRGTVVFEVSADNSRLYITIDNRNGTTDTVVGYRESYLADHDQFGVDEPFHFVIPAGHKITVRVPDAATPTANRADNARAIVRFYHDRHLVHIAELPCVNGQYTETADIFVM